VENKYIIVARESVNISNPTEITDQKVVVCGILGGCTFNELREIYPTARQFMVLNANGSLWDDIEDFASVFIRERIANVNTIMLEQGQLLGYICLDSQEIRISHIGRNLPITFSPQQNFKLVRTFLAEKITYHSRSPAEEFAKPNTPSATQMLTNDQVHWLTQQYLKTCAGNRFWLDRHGNIELITSLDGTPAYFYPPYADAEEVVDNQHRIDLIVADIWRRLYNCGETAKMPKEFIINQIICQGARRGSIAITGSHWVVRSVRLSGLDSAKLAQCAATYAQANIRQLKEADIADLIAAGLINQLYRDCTLSYLNSAGDKTSKQFEKYLKGRLCCATNITAINIIVPNQFCIGSVTQKGVICGDLAVQNAVSFTIYGCVPTSKQYTTRDEHCIWISQNHAVIGNDIRWKFELTKTLAETLDVADELIQLDMCDNLDFANAIIADIRSKVAAWIEKTSQVYYQKNNTFLASLNFISYSSRASKLQGLVALQSLIPAQNEKLSLNTLQEVELKAPSEKVLFDSIRLIEAIISRNLDRLKIFPLADYTEDSCRTH